MAFTRFVIILAAGLIGCAQVAARAQAGAERPNIIFILADDLGYGELGCYGQQKIKTPNLDRMAAEGMRFTQFYAGSTVCAPSRCVLMTGLHTGHCLIRGNARYPLRPEDVTVAEVLKPAGYTNALIGKWGLGEEGSTGIPTRQGFDYFFGYLNQQHAHNYYPAFLMRNEQRIPLRNRVLGSGDWGVGYAIEKVDYSHDLMAEEALNWLERNRDRTFFLYLAFTIPHANNEAGRALGDGQEVPDYGIYENENWSNQNKGQAAMITRMDRDIGRIFDKLTDLGLDEKTIVLFSSDNGPHKEGGNNIEFFNPSGPLRGIKRDLYDGGIRVPMIARWPGKIRPGTTSSHVSYFGDFMATAAELAGVTPPDGLDSISFVPALLGETERQKQHEYLYWEFHEGGFKQAVRFEQYKAIRLRPGALVELYDLSGDISEQRNIAAEHPELVARAERYLNSARTESQYWPVRGSNAGPAGRRRGQ